MKQTNNAIKFLMAQYRAIFKNANIAMVAAMVAAALAAGQANAANLEQAGWANLAGDKTAGSGGDFESVEITAKEDSIEVNKNAFTLTITSGSGHFIDGKADNKGGFTATSGSLIIEGKKEATDTKLTIGKTSGGAVTFEDVSIIKGSIEVSNSGSLTATKGLTLGDKSALSITDGGKVASGNIELQSGAAVTVTKGELGDAASNITILDGASVTGDGGNADEAVVKGTVNVSGGTLKTTANNKHLTVGGALNLKAGKIEVASGSTVKFGGAFNATSGTLTNASGGNVTFTNDATFASGTVANKGVITVSGGTINVDSVKGLYDEGTSGGQLKLESGSLVFTGDKLDISNAYMSGDANSSLKVSNGELTINKEFDKKVPNVEAATIVAKTAEETSLGIPNKKDVLLISGGSVTALNELKGDKANSQIVIYNSTSGGTASLTLGKDASTVGKLTNISRVYAGDGQQGKDSKNVLNVNGKWDFNLSKLAVGTGATLNIKQGAEVNNVYWLQMHGFTDTAAANIDGTLNVGRLLGSEKNNSGDTAIKGSINVTGALNVFGDGKADGPSDKQQFGNDVQLAYTKLNINAGGTVALATKDAWDDVIEATTDSGTGLTTFEVIASGGNTTDFGGWTADNVNIKAGGTLRIDLSGYKVADKAALDALSKGLMASGSKGLIDFGGLSVDKLVTNADGSIDLANMPTVKTEATKDLAVNLGGTTTLDKSYSMGSANVSGSSLTAGEGTTLEFNNAKNGQFATNTSAAAGADSSVNVTLSKDSALNLNGNGSLGNIEAAAGASGSAAVLGGNNGTQTVGNVSVETLNIVGGNVTSKAVTIADGATVNGVLNAAGAVSAKTLSVGDSGAIHAAGQSITVSEANAAANILGDVEAGSLALSGGATVAGGADLKLGTLNLAGTKKLNVGRDGADGSSAAIFADKLVMGKGSTIFVDPDYKQRASVVSAVTLTDGTTQGNTADGDIKVGKNAVFALGATEDEFNSLMAAYMDGDRFADPATNPSGYANALLVDDSLVVKSGSGILVDSTATDATTVTDNSVTLGKNAVLIVTENALDNGSAAITLGQGASAAFTATVKADASSKVSLVGDFSAKSTDIKLFGVASSGTLTVNNINVDALGGLLTGTVGNNGTVASLALSQDAKAKAYQGVARPVGDFFLGIANGDYAVDSNQLGHKFVISTMNQVGGYPVVDTAAHAATYAGAQQAAVASVTTMADAMFGRVGAVGVEAASIAATGSQANGGVWLTPMYKSMDSDGFNAEGACYGSDVDVAGVAFGADTVNGNMRFGAVFNIGSGDADGKGQGNGLKDDFDYYGFGIYSAMGFGNLALVGDASMTVISHDVEGLGLRGKADTTAVTMGLTGQYTVVTPVVDVTPHLGARFIRLNTDSYDLKSADGAIATTDFDVQNVFSVPLGVTLSKGFTTGGWTLAPSADLTITFNTGDTEAKSTTTFSGIGHGIALNTEVLDEVQYGVSLGLGAQYGAFGTSFGINYTGSENTDSFGVNAQCRYMF